MNLLVPKSSKKFYCKNCDYGTCRKTQFDRHLMTAKHKILTNTYQILTEPSKKSTTSLFVCKCGKEYKHKQSLNNHKYKCKLNDESVNTLMIKDDNNDLNYKHMFYKMVEENKEVRTLLITQQQQIENQQKMMGDLIPKVGNNNTINNNQRFNINVFLNEKCKDAINMNDFLKSIEVSLQQLDLTTTKGLEYGLSNLIIENMNKLSLYERPLHCTDTKRETLYIKNDDIWEKDKDKTKIKRAIKHASNKQYKALHEWTNENPDFKEIDEKQDYFAKVLSTIGKDISSIDEKVIKKICSNTYLKESLDD